MTHYRQLMERDYLGAYDCADAQGKPRAYTLEIVSVDSVALKTRETPKGRRKIVITFRGAQKKFVCNSTNAETIASLYGPDVEGWAGKRITIYQADVRSPKGNGTIKGLRVHARRPTGPAESVEERPVDRAMRDEQDRAFDNGGEREPGEDG